jgi:hypothetical protein
LTCARTAQPAGYSRRHPAWKSLGLSPNIIRPSINPYLGRVSFSQPFEFRENIDQMLELVGTRQREADPTGLSLHESGRDKWAAHGPASAHNF